MEFEIRDLHHFLSLKRRLCEALMEQYECDLTDESLLSWPKKGGVSLETVNWTFTKHGSGYCFSSPQGIVIDCPSGLPRSIDTIDSWSILQYLESRSESGNLSNQDEVDSWLHELNSVGSIRKGPRAQTWVLPGGVKQ